MKQINSHFQRFHIETIMYLIIIIIALILLYLVMNNKLNLFQHFSGCPIPDLPLKNVDDNDIYNFNKPLNKDIILLFIHSPNCPYSVNFKENVWDNYFIKPKPDRTYPTINIIDRHGHDGNEKNSDFGFDNMKYVLNSHSLPENYRIHSFFHNKFKEIYYYDLSKYGNSVVKDDIHCIKTIIDQNGEPVDAGRGNIHLYLNELLKDSKKFLKTPSILLFDTYFFRDVTDNIETYFREIDVSKPYKYFTSLATDDKGLTIYENIPTASVKVNSNLIIQINSSYFEEQIGAYLNKRFNIFVSGEDGFITCHKKRDKLSGISNPNYGTDENKKPYIFIFAENICNTNHRQPIDNLHKFVTQEIEGETPYIREDDGTGKLKEWNYGLDNKNIIMLTKDLKKTISLNITSCPTLILQYGNHYEFINNEKLLDGWRDKLTVTEESLDDNTKRWETSDELKAILDKFADYYEKNKPTTAVEKTTSAAEKEQEQTTSAAEQEQKQTTSAAEQEQTTSAAEQQKEQEQQQTTSTS